MMIVLMWLNYWMRLVIMMLCDVMLFIESVEGASKLDVCVIVGGGATRVAWILARSPAKQQFCSGGQTRACGRLAARYTNRGGGWSSRWVGVRRNPARGLGESSRCSRYTQT